MIRVAYIVHTFDVGGLERCIARLANCLDRQRFQPLIVCLNRTGTAADWIKVDDVPIFEIHKQPRNDLGAVLRLSRLLKREKVTVVHSHNWGTLLETLVARRLAGVPIHVHAERGTVLGGLDMSPLRKRVRGMATRWALNQASVVIANAASIAQRLDAACGFPANRVQLIANGVDPLTVDNPAETRQKIRHSLQIPDDCFLVGSVGRLAGVKNFRLAIDAISRLQGDHSNVHLLLVGDGDERAALTRKTEELRLGARVHFAGRQDNIANWLAACDLYINVSLSEGMSQSVIEAMAAAKPLVVTDVGDNAILVGGEEPCGRVVRSNDIDALALRIGEFADQPALCGEFGNRALSRFLALYSTTTMVDHYESLYSQMTQHLHRCVTPQTTETAAVVGR